MKLKLSLLAVLAVALIAVFLFIHLGPNWDYALPRRLKKVLAIVITGGAIAYSTMIFQTITNNRILTPSIIGLDSLYMLIQTFVIFAFGSMSLPSTNKHLNFFISVALMIAFVAVLYKLLFQKEGRNLYFLLLIGLVLGTLFGSMSTFMQVLIDPNEFLIVQGKMFASFNNVNTDLLVISIVIIGIIAIYVTRLSKYLDVMSLGKEHAVNLGIPYDYVVKRMLVIVAILIAVSTALVGPITFLGLLVVNVAYQFMRTYRHSFLIPGAMLISIIALVGGQLIVERVFTFETTISVIINFIGGAYFLYLLLREKKA
ncbi:iron chelate uptake ABC transporter family permease subunit [Paenibacillus sp. PL91]|uniref:iron chelate uptake ABC transporter family permease subunit n=1 Tax=Paenibacillus sp. PL91 TaxID=2729538 RepID=UPI00145F4558|nr:iron chelate uptake ABC transporter family permease subunit [Paenibacillus sp. PL91]MBC9202104.1 iron chelate uptake ABC transporter family permease subunit [Paenibacillus sp. PL91]